MSKKYDLVVNIGRFEPWHNGHDHLDDFSVSLANNQLILLGSSHQARSPKNPFSGEEREEMIVKRKLFKKNNVSFNVWQIRDYDGRDQLWAAQIQDMVEVAIGAFELKNPSICLVGHKKDESSYYLSMFPQWDFIDHKPIIDLNATQVRDLWLRDKSLDIIEKYVPKQTRDYLYDWQQKHPKEYKQLCEEHDYYLEYPKKWGLGPHITVDSLVTCCGHVLLIQRGKDPANNEVCPGEGLWAMPGGFLGRNERILDGAVRELKEETNIDVPVKVLKGSVADSLVVDHPGRSLRGRVITHVYHMHLWDTKLPKVKAASDAKKAVWKPLSWCKANPHLFFEDHYQILERIISGGDK